MRRSNSSVDILSETEGQNTLIAESKINFAEMYHKRHCYNTFRNNVIIFFILIFFNSFCAVKVDAKWNKDVINYSIMC